MDLMKRFSFFSLQYAKTTGKETTGKNIFLFHYFSFSLGTTFRGLPPASFPYPLQDNLKTGPKTSKEASMPKKFGSTP